MENTKHSLAKNQGVTKTILVMNVPTKKGSPLASRIRLARKKLGISQMELGVRAGMDEYSASARMNQYERGKHSPDYLTVSNLADVLGVPVAYLYAREDNLADLILLWGSLGAEGKTELISLIRSRIDLEHGQDKT